MVKLNTHIKAFTVLESMIAMLIIMIVFGMSTYVFVNISSSGFTPQKKKAYMLVKQLRNETIKNKRYIDEHLEEDNLFIQKTIEDFNGSEILKTLHISATFNEKTIYASKDLILVTNEF